MPKVKDGTFDWSALVNSATAAMVQIWCLHHPSCCIFLFLILKGLLDNVISYYLWARAVILTSATVASGGSWSDDTHGVRRQFEVAALAWSPR